MDQRTIKQITDKNTWESFLQSYPEATFLQSWYWGDFHKALGKKIMRTGFYNNTKLTGVMLCIVERAKRATYLTVPGGPLIPWTDDKCVSVFVQAIKQIAIQEKCSFVRVRPQLRDDSLSQTIFKKSGFFSAPMHLHAELTSQLDITQPDETLLANMRKATRYEIKKARTLGITITKSADPAKIKNFYELQIATSQRQKFIPFSYSFLYKQFSIFAKAKKVLLYSAFFEERLLAQAIIIFYGEEASYHYGASSDSGRDYPGAYLIQWEAIKEAKSRGMKRYNFWGVSPLADSDHRFAGISLFKRGFGGNDVAYLHAQDLIMNYPKYTINFFIENIRKHIRHV